VAFDKGEDSLGATPQVNRRMVALIALHPLRVFDFSGNGSEWRGELSYRNQVLGCTATGVRMRRKQGEP
jgi:hypothetical protein